MVTQKLFKRRVRERMAKTGESYTAARSHLAAKRDRLRTARAGPTVTPAPASKPVPIDLSGALELASDARVRQATGRGWEQWLSLLDELGARDLKRGRVVEVLMQEHGVPGWYAQTIASGYERTRGIRQKHQQADGFTIYATRTVGVPVEAAFEAFADDGLRARWLTDGSMALRTARSAVSARFDWAGGPTRVSVTFDPKGPAKTSVAVAHERLATPQDAEAAKAAWKPRLAALKALLEGSRAS